MANGKDSTLRYDAARLEERIGSTIVEPSLLETVLHGKQNVPSFYYADALLCDDNGKPRARNNRDSLFIIHALNAALKPEYRFNDPKLPSKYKISPENEIAAGLLHDVPEDAELSGYNHPQQRLLRTIVIQDTLGIFDPAVYFIVHYLTNYPIQSLDALKREIGQKEPNASNALEALGTLEKKVLVTDDIIEGMYKAVLAKLETQKSLAEQIRDNESEQRIAILDGNYHLIRDRMSSNRIVAYKATESLKQHYLDIMNLLMSKDRYKPEQELVISATKINEHPFYTRLKFSIYLQLYMERMDPLMISRDFNGSVPFNPYSPFVVKGSEASHNAVSMKFSPFPISTLLKIYLQLKKGNDIMIRDRDKKIFDPRYPHVLNYLNGVTINQLPNMRRHLEVTADMDTEQARYLPAMTTLEGKFNDLQSRLNEMNKPTIRTNANIPSDDLGIREAAGVLAAFKVLGDLFRNKQ